jgi:hypothetical protein
MFRGLTAGAALNDVPFTIGEVIAIGSLSEALARLVFDHPDVRALCVRAIAAAGEQRISFEEDAGLVGLVTGHDEPLLPLRYFQKHTCEFIESLPSESPEEDSLAAEYLHQGWPPEIEAYYGAVNLRARTLIEMLQDRKIVSRGHSSDGHLILIAHSIWSHDDYYVHPPTGDVYEARPHAMRKKWTGVIFEAPDSLPPDRLFHGKHTEHDSTLPATISRHDESSATPRKSAWRASIEEAVAALWPSGIPATLVLKTRDELIADWQRRNKLTVATSKTIRRHLTREGQFRR